MYGRLVVGCIRQGGRRAEDGSWIPAIVVAQEGNGDRG